MDKKQGYRVGYYEELELSPPLDGFQTFTYYQYVNTTCDIDIVWIYLPHAIENMVYIFKMNSKVVADVVAKVVIDLSTLRPLT
jgi:hypothetical protein